MKHKGTKKLFALKYIDKFKCSDQGAVESIIQERFLLEEIKNNFVVYSPLQLTVTGICDMPSRTMTICSW